MEPCFGTSIGNVAGTRGHWPAGHIGIGAWDGDALLSILERGSFGLVGHVRLDCFDDEERERSITAD